MNEVKKNQTEKKSVFNKWFYIGLAITFAVLCIVCTVIFLYEFYVIRLVENALGEKVLTGHNLMNMLYKFITNLKKNLIFFFFYT